MKTEGSERTKSEKTLRYEARKVEVRNIFEEKRFGPLYITPPKQEVVDGESGARNKEFAKLLLGVTIGYESLIKEIAIRTNAAHIAERIAKNYAYCIRGSTYMCTLVHRTDPSQHILGSIKKIVERIVEGF